MDIDNVMEDELVDVKRKVVVSAAKIYYDNDILCTVIVVTIKNNNGYNAEIEVVGDVSAFVDQGSEFSANLVAWESVIFSTMKPLISSL